MSFSFFLPAVKSAGNEIYVNASHKGYSDGTAEKPYGTIQEALDNAEEEDTIYIFSGLYQEDLTIGKKIKMIGGIDGEETIIDTRFDRRYLVEITADEVTIEGITFSDEDSSMTSPIGAFIAIKSDNNRIVRNIFKSTCGYGIYIDPSSSDNLVSNNIISYTKSGIYISSSSTNDLANNEIDNSTEYGIYMKSSGGNNRLYANKIYDCPHGIFVESSNNLNLTYNNIMNSKYYAIYVSQCHDGFITSNVLKDCVGEGIFFYSEDFCIEDNIITDSRRGITIAGSGNTIKNNTFQDLSASGIYVQSGYDNNLFYLNKFKNNGASAKDQGDNQWYYLSSGNYWSDYDNVDKDEDGIGDVSYSKEGVVDKYPLGYFLKPPSKASNPSPADKEDDVGLQITLEVTVTDPDSGYLDVYFYRGDDDTLIDSSTQNPKKHVQKNAVVQCKFTLGFERTFAWYVVTDDGLLQNTSDPFFFSTISTPPDNKPPVVDSGGPYDGEAKEPVTFDASGCYDPDGEIDFYRWNFGDGSSEILQENPTHIYKNEGTYEVTLTVIDDNGTSETETTLATIQPYVNSPPTVEISVPTKGYVGEQISFVSISNDPNGDPLTYSWSIDGNLFAESNVIYEFNIPGDYLVNLTVSDGKFEEISVAQITIEKKQEETPGFELMIFLVAAIVILFTRRKTYPN